MTERRLRLPEDDYRGFYLRSKSPSCFPRSNALVERRVLKAAISKRRLRIKLAEPMLDALHHFAARVEDPRAMGTELKMPISALI